MSKDKISDYSTTANSNTDIGGINVDEGCAPSGINDAIRTLMAQLKTWQSGGQDVYIHPAGTASAPSITANGDTNTGIFFPAADTVGITTGGTERVRVDSAGNAGLGATPSAWVSGDTVLQVKAGSGSGALWGRSNSLRVVANTYFDGTNYKYIATDYASFMNVGQSGVGGFSWNIAPSGTAGTNATFTQAMTLDASGNLGIGTTSPQRQLHINGTTGSLRLQGTSSGAYIEIVGPSNSNYIGTPAAISSGSTTDLAFFVSSTERARIDSSGNLLVGTTSVLQSSQVSIASSGKALLAYVNAATTTTIPAARFVKYDNNSTTSNKLIDFEINQGSAGSGQINANGASQAAFGSYSDARLKENIVDLPPQLANILALRPVEFDYIESEGGGHQISFLAQEFELVYADAVGERDDGMKTLTGWGKTEARLVKAIQEQQAIITALTARIEALEQA